MENIKHSSVFSLAEAIKGAFVVNLSMPVRNRSKKVEKKALSSAQKGKADLLVYLMLTGGAIAGTVLYSVF